MRGNLAPQLSWIEQLPSKQQVVRSNRTGVAKCLFMKKYLNIFTILVTILFSFILKKKISAELLHLNCRIINNSNNFNEISKFYRIIDVERKKIIYQSGITFDKIKHFNQTEIIMHNNIYENYSVLNLSSYVWTIYKRRKILNYNCNKKKAPN